MNTADKALAATLQHRVGLARYSTHVLRRVIKLVNDGERDVLNTIRVRFGNNPIDTSTWSGKRLAAMLTTLRGINREAHEAIYRETGKGLEAQAAYEVDWTKELTSRVGIDGTFTRPSAAKLKALVYRSPFAGGVLKDVVRRLERSSFERLQKAIRLGILEGESLDQIVRRITGDRELLYVDGVTSVQRRGVERIVRTAITHVNVATQREIMAANPHLYRGWMFVAVLDERTSLICMGNSGQVFPVEKGPFPPLHYYCRSTILPLLKSQKEDPKIKTYEQWLKEQPEDVQREILGRTRFDLWKQGGLNLRQFVDGGKAFTIEELRKRDAAAFARAGLGSLGEGEATPSTPPVRSTPIDVSLRVDPADFRLPRNSLHSEQRRGTNEAIFQLFDEEKKRTAEGVPSIERMAIIDEDGLGGQRLYPGEDFRIRLPESVRERFADPTRRVIAHHTHPIGNSLSDKDLNVYAASPGMSRLWAHGHDGSHYVISRPLALQRFYNLKEAKPGEVAAVINDASGAMDNYVRQVLVGADQDAIRAIVPSLNRTAAHMMNQGLHEAGLTRYRAVLSDEVREHIATMERLRPGMLGRMREAARQGAVSSANARNEDLAYVMRLTADAARGKEGANARIRDYLSDNWRDPLIRAPSPAQTVWAQTNVGRNWVPPGGDRRQFELWTQRWAHPFARRNSGVQSYQGTGFSAINEALRNPGRMTDATYRDILRIDGEMALSRLPETGLVDRGLSRLEVLKAAGVEINNAAATVAVHNATREVIPEFDLRQLVGKTITNRAYTSVTVDSEIAATFARRSLLAHISQTNDRSRPDLWPVILRFVTPKGMSALPGSAVEGELILPRGLKLVIDEVLEGDITPTTHEPGGKAWYLIARIVP